MGARIAVSWQWGGGMRCAEVESRTMIAVDLSGFLEECCCRWRGKSCLPRDEKLTLVRAASAEEASGQCEGEILAFSGCDLKLMFVSKIIYGTSHCRGEILEMAE